MATVLSDVWEIHISDVGTYKGCRREWHFSSPLRLNLAPKIPSKHLWGGGITHYALGAYYHPEKARTIEVLEESFGEAIMNDSTRLIPFYGTEVMDELNEMAELLRGVLEHYHLWAQEHDNFQVLEPEVELRVRLPLVGPDGRPVDYVGSADLLLQELKAPKDVLIGEFKTAASFPNIQALYVDDQFLAYNWAAQLDPRYQGMRPVGTQYTFLRKKLPALPEPLKRGGLSQRKDMDTTYELYLAALKDNGIPPILYGEMLNHLRQKGNTFFHRTTIKPPAGALVSFGQNLMTVATEMLSPTVATYPSGNRFKCGYCGFRLPCMFMTFGIDPTPLLEADYQQRPHRAVWRYGLGTDLDA